MNKILANTIKTKLDWEQQRYLAEIDPGKFHGDIAKKTIYWFNPEISAWIKYFDTDNKWHGYSNNTGLEVDCKLQKNYLPWHTAFDDREAPLYRWYSGAETNACFNEVDVHVLGGYGDEIAFYFEGDRWDPSLNNGKGGPVNFKAVTRKELMWEVAKCAVVLQNLGLKKGDRIALNMPNILEQIYFIEAAKRLGVIYTCVFGGYSAKTLSDRIHDAGAKIVITTDGAYRNAQIVGFKELFTDKALDDYIPATWGIDQVKILLKKDLIEENYAQLIIEAVELAITGEITIERAEIMRGVGNALDNITTWDVTKKSKLRTGIAEALVNSPARVEHVIVVQHTKMSDLSWNSRRDLWAHELQQKAADQFIGVSGSEDILKLPLHKFIEIIYSLTKPLPVPADFPLFIIYTSGSTGKPKGVVHTHGGYVAGVAYTMQIAFDIPVNPELNKGQVIYVVADPGWITGQSYLICASLVTRTTGVITEGSPLFPHAGRFASIIDRYKVTVFKAGSTFLKTVASDPQNVEDVKRYDLSSLRVGSFCAEPTSPSIQQFAMDLLTQCYINSYWATEHGGIILTHFYGNKDYTLKADAHTFPMPWIFADVWIHDGSGYRVAEFEEKGEIVITKPYPYLARTLWGDTDNVNNESWKGDIERFKKVYFSSWPQLAYTQGDFASKYIDGGMSLHGRSDDVINTSGHRIGTEEIEGAILKDKQLNPKSIVGNAIVVGAPHPDKGTVPVAFILVNKGSNLSLEDEKRLINLVREEKGIVAVPAGFITVSQFPETRSGKYMRRLLRDMLEGEPLGDTSALRNPESLTEVERGIRNWQAKMALEQEHNILEVLPTLRVETHEIKSKHQVAIVTLDRAPVNALDERTLDELTTVLEHLENRDDIKVIILTGAGTKAFVSGADIRQLLEEMRTKEDVLPLSHQAAKVMCMIEAMSKPVIAAINGVALGGGNELQMACHYRIAEPVAKFGQPEINLHLIPGYGGTQRLPRLLCDHAIGAGCTDPLQGIILAAQIIFGGRSIDAIDAEKIGLIHEIVHHTDVVSHAVELAREYITNNTGILKEEHSKRIKKNLAWKKQQRFPYDAFMNNSDIKELLTQAQAAGRSAPIAWAIDAIKFGWENGFDEGLNHESELFATAVVDPKGGKLGIRAFFDRKSAALPVRKSLDLQWARAHEAEILGSGELLKFGSPFFPGVDTIPKYQYAYLVEKDVVTGVPKHGDPIVAEVKRIIPVEEPSAMEGLLYMLSSEINFNDIWAITGVPVSPFESHDQDWHVTGSGGLALVVALGDELKAEGRIKVGDLVEVFSGQSQLLDPTAGLDPMFADQHIQGYEIPNGSHQQFMIAQGPQIHHKVAELNLESAGSYILNLGTIYRAMFTTLKIETGKTIFIEGAATGTGAEAVKVAAKNKLKVIGLVSSLQRAESVLENGAIGTINRSDPDLRDIYTLVPENPKAWDKWQAQGDMLLQKFKQQANGRLADYVISHAGELSFPRSFQLLAPGGILTFYGGSSGYHFTFMGKSGAEKPEVMLSKVEAQAGADVLVFYGLECGGASDPVGLEIIEACREMQTKIAVCTQTNVQANFVKSLGFGDAVRGVFSIEDLKRKEADQFVWPDTMPPLPDSKNDTEAFKEAVRWYQEYVFKPFAAQVGSMLRSPDNPRGYPDIIFERAQQDTLCLSTMLVKPYTGKVVYTEDMKNRRYSFYAPQLWMRQRRIYMPTANIWGTHLSNAYEVQKMNELLNAGFLHVDEPFVVDEFELAQAHQDMWENKHKGANYLFNHALPRMGLKTKDDLYHAWAISNHADQKK
jgi:acrylyl-CoA reductase (NADPH)/3-hydroxypropionyl-CoA dehydratase/3-hydroxypropionyl-CoA synthetase